MKYLIRYFFAFMGGHKNSFFHLKLIGKMSFNLNFRALKGSVAKVFTVFATALMVKVFFVAATVAVFPPSTVFPQHNESLNDKMTEHEKASYVAYSRGDFRIAIDEMTACLAIAEKMYGDRSAANTMRYIYLGMFQYQGGDYSGSNASYEKAIPLLGAETDANRVNLANAYSGLASAQQMLGKYDVAISTAKKSLDFFSRCRLEKEAKWYPANPWYTIGLAYQYKGDYARSEESLLKARDIYASVLGNRNPYVGTALYELGVTANLKGDRIAARSYFQTALEIYRSSYGENHPFLGSVYYALADLLYMNGEYNKAITYCERAILMYKNGYGEKHAFVAIAYYELGRIYVQTDECKRAIACFEKALAIDLEVFGEDHINTAATILGFATAYEKLGQHEESFVYLKRALAAQRKVLGADHPDIVYTMIEIGNYHADKKNIREAIDTYNSALALAGKNFAGDHPAVGAVYKQIGIAHLIERNSAAAEEPLARALSIAKKRSDDPLLVSVSEYLAYMKMNIRAYSEARKYYGEIISIVEKKRSKADAERMSIMGNGIRFYYESLYANVMIGDTSEVFTMAESMKARGFLDRISLEAALSVKGIDADMKKKILELNDKIAALIAERNDLIRKNNQIGSVRLAVLGDELDTTGSLFESLDAALMKNEQYRNLRKPHIATLADAQALCDKNSAILEYVIPAESPGSLERMYSRPYCIVVRSDAVAVVALDEKFDFAGTVDEFRTSIIEPNRGRKRDKLGVMLYDKLISPVEKYLAGVNRIVIVPDGNLSFLPFDALRKNDKSAYLCERYVVTMSPSISVMKMVKLREFREKREGLIAFGGAFYSKKEGAGRGRRGGILYSTEIGSIEKNIDPEMSVSDVPYYRTLSLIWENLPGTLEEVNAIGSAVYGGKDSKIITGTNVTEAMVKKISRENGLVRYRSIHFACHGYYDPDKPAYSAVVLSEVSGSVKTGEDGYLSVPEVSALNLRADIVTLSACETGLGKIVQGDGVVGLARAFAEAGANRVSVTLWQVADEQTKKFMISLYRRVIKERKSFALAIAETKREFIRSKKFNDPYFWSSFVLYGE
jgi:CHAT domain-containing protein